MPVHLTLRTLPGVILALCLALMATASRAGDTAAPAGILFVHFRWDTNGISVVESSVRPGRLKGQGTAPGTLELRLADVSGKALWAGRTQDPRFRHHEGPVGPGPGALVRVTGFLPTSEWEVRVPMDSRAAELQLLGEPVAGPVLQGEGESLPRPILVRLPLAGLLRRPVP